MQCHVTQKKGTERPFTGAYNKFYEKGMYSCIVCDQELFSSDTKYDNGCGWPAFNEALDQDRIKLTRDTSLCGTKLLQSVINPNMVRTEVTCSKCNAHFGHTRGQPRKNALWHFHFFPPILVLANLSHSTSS